MAPSMLRYLNDRSPGKSMKMAGISGELIQGTITRVWQAILFSLKGLGKSNFSPPASLSSNECFFQTSGIRDA
jgi:hypothetical protein